MEDIGNGLSLLAILGFVAFLIWHGDKSKQSQRELKVAERERILDRIGTGEALTSFLESAEGKAFLRQLNEPVKGRHGGGSLKMSVIGLLTGGVITLLVGASFFYAAPRVQDSLIVPGGIIAAVGIGCLIGALIQYVIGKAWGLLDDTDRKDEDPRRRLE